MKLVDVYEKVNLPIYTLLIYTIITYPNIKRGTHGPN